MRSTFTAAVVALIALQAAAKPLFGHRFATATHRALDDEFCSRCSIHAVFGSKSKQLSAADAFCSSYIAPTYTTTVLAVPTQYNPRQKSQKQIAVTDSLPTPTPAAHLAAQVISSACSCIVKAPLPTVTSTKTVTPPPPTNVPNIYTPIDSMDELKKRGPADFAPFGSGAIPVPVEERAFGVGSRRDFYREH